MITKNNSIIFLIVIATITQFMYFLFLFLDRKEINSKSDLLLKKEESINKLMNDMYLYTDSINRKLDSIEAKKAEIITINNTYVQNSKHIYNLSPEDTYLLFTEWLSKIDTIR
jgi:hypothetical protein